MKYQFSFNDKKEIIFIDEEPYQKEIGTLLNAFIDADWDKIIEMIQLYEKIKLFENKEALPLIKEQIHEAIKHPALTNHLLEHIDGNEIMRYLKDCKTTKENVLFVFETLVDEETRAYSEILFDLLYVKQPEALSRNFFQAQDARVMPITKWVMPLYAKVEGYPFLFETEDLKAILLHEIQYLCINHFILRKCSCCRRFFWTKKTNKIYCNRIKDGTKKTCAQIGPIQRCASKRHPAYKVYWNNRTRLFNRQAKSDSKNLFQMWLERTEPYKEIAKQGEISPEEMQDILSAIEEEIYH